MPGEALGLVGESGCGKSTLGRCIVGLHAPTAGEIRYAGDAAPAEARRGPSGRRIQMVFQDPYSSLNPRMTVRQTLSELLRVHKMTPRSGVDARCRELLDLVGLPARALDSHPRNFSGGQRQRVSIARALALEPELLVADEPVSALDVSVQATVLNLLDELRRELGLTMLFIAHNMAVVRHVCDRVAVMYLGRIVETAATEELFQNARHPYTQGLLKAVPRLVPGRVSRVGRRGGRPAEPDRRAVRLPVPSPLPARPAGVLGGRPAACRRKRRAAPGRLPLRLDGAAARAHSRGRRGRGGRRRRARPEASRSGRSGRRAGRRAAGMP